MMKAMSTLVSGLFALLVGSLPSPAAEPLYRIACPSSWPGPSRTELPITYFNYWINWIESAPPDAVEEALDGRGPGEVQLDCAYGKDAYTSPFRVTLVIPGHPAKCFMEKHRGLQEAACETRPERSGILGPATWQVAELVGPGTTFFGFGLEQSYEQVRENAGKEKFEVREAHGEIHLRRADDRLVAIISPDTGLTSEVVWKAPESEQAKLAFGRGLTFRFGLHRDWQPFLSTNRNIVVSKTVWKSASSTVVVEIHPGPKGFAESAHITTSGAK